MSVDAERPSYELLLVYSKKMRVGERTIYIER